MNARTLLASVLCSSLAAQAPSPWAMLAVPGGVASSSIGNLGKIITYPTGGVLNVWSAMTRHWSHLTGLATLLSR
ncbi:MAG: hypothetical protein WAT39_06030 [Planctomycetota bacterium]